MAVMSITSCNQEETKEGLQTMTDVLERYREDLDGLVHLEMADPADAGAFPEIIRCSLEVLQLQQKELAADLGVTPPTISRWVRGHNTPHPAFARAIYAQVAKLAKEEQAKVQGLYELYKDDGLRAQGTVHPLPGFFDRLCAP